MAFVRHILFALALLAAPFALWAETPICINTADASVLAGLTGVGAQRAAAIVAYREEHGPFASVDELAKVKGVGARTLEANRERLVATSPAE
jgi:competence protein ComEA